MNRITADTTDEQILSGIKAAQEALVNRALSAQETDEVRGPGLVNAAQRVADNEDLARAQFRFREYLRRNRSQDQIMGLLFDLTNPPRQINGAVCSLVRSWATNEVDNIRHWA